MSGFASGRMSTRIPSPFGRPPEQTCRISWRSQRSHGSDLRDQRLRVHPVDLLRLIDLVVEVLVEHEHRRALRHDAVDGHRPAVLERDPVRCRIRPLLAFARPSLESSG
jgi:hypothetical protein